MLDLAATTTALVLIDVQTGTLAMPLAPHPAETIVRNAARLARHFAKVGATVILVRVAFSEGYVDRPNRPTDVPMATPAGGPPPGWSDLAPELAAIKADLVITKRQWSAFYGTELDLQLRRRGIVSVVIGGIATNFGVESTARDAWQNNYAVVIAEDATSSVSEEHHRFAIEKTLPRVARIRSVDEIIAALPVQ